MMSPFGGENHYSHVFTWMCENHSYVLVWSCGSLSEPLFVQLLLPRLALDKDRCLNNIINIM